MIINKNYPGLSKHDVFDDYVIDGLIVDDSLVIDLDDALYVSGTLEVRGNLTANVPIELECGEKLIVTGGLVAEEICGEDGVLLVDGEAHVNNINLSCVSIGQKAVVDNLQCMYAVMKQDAKFETVNCACEIVVGGQLTADKVFYFDEEDDCGEVGDQVESVIVGGDINCPDMRAMKLIDNCQNIDDAISKCLSNFH